MTYRKKTYGNTWHFCHNCSKIPSYDYNEQNTRPTHGAICSECTELLKKQNCQKL